MFKKNANVSKCKAVSNLEVLKVSVEIFVSHFAQYTEQTFEKGHLNDKSGVILYFSYRQQIQ